MIYATDINVEALNTGSGVRFQAPPMMRTWLLCWGPWTGTLGGFAGLLAGFFGMWLWSKSLIQQGPLYHMGLSGVPPPGC